MAKGVDLEGGMGEVTERSCKSFEVWVCCEVPSPIGIGHRLIIVLPKVTGGLWPDDLLLFCFLVDTVEVFAHSRVVQVVTGLAKKRSSNLFLNCTDDLVEGLEGSL